MENQPTDRSGVLAANASFYSAFERLDLEAMSSLWARSVPVTCVHPGWDVVAGIEAILQSWRAIFEGTSELRLRVEDPHVTLAGTLAWVVCREQLFTTVQGSAVENTLTATNGFVYEQGVWRVAHHHAGPVLQGRTRSVRPPDTVLH